MQKISVGNQEGDHLMCRKPWLPFFSFSLVTILHVYSKHCQVQGPFYIFCSLPIFDRELSFFFCFLPIFDWEHSSFFLLLLKHICSLTGNRSSFLGDPSIPTPDGKGKNSYPRSRFIANELRFRLKRLVEGRAWCMSGIFVQQAVQG